MTPVRPLYVPPPYQDSAESGRLILRDGTTAAIRPAQPGDRDLLQAFFNRLSTESRWRRFFSMAGPAMKVVDSLCDSSEPRSRLTLVVLRTIEGPPRLIAPGTYFHR